MTKKTDVLHVGIDLGTSRSSISASNGGRHVVESYVGWPVDMVARRLVKKPILFGREALDSRPMRAVVGVPAEALRVSRQNLRNAVKGVADGLMIVSEPFAVSYGMDAL